MNFDFESVILTDLGMSSLSNKRVTKILRKVRAITFTENYGKLRIRGGSLARARLFGQESGNFSRVSMCRKNAI